MRPSSGVRQSRHDLLTFRPVPDHTNGHALKLAAADSAPADEMTSHYFVGRRERVLASVPSDGEAVRVSNDNWAVLPVDTPRAA